MTPALRLAAVVLLLAGNARAQPDGGWPCTELGPGNEVVAASFTAYRGAHPDGACHASGNGRRVIVTGFGPFVGAPYNISGTVVASMADPAFWPDRAVTGLPAHGRTATAGTVSTTDNGARAFNRSLLIDGQRFEVCFLVMSVVWDLAGAIIVYEEDKFDPRAVIMTGRGMGELSVEAGALNLAASVPGYGPTGMSLGDDNMPRSPAILVGDKVGADIPMNWDAEALAAASEADARELGYPTVARTSGRVENDYLCNNVSYIALNAARRRSSMLAGGLIRLPPPDMPARPVTGFLHFPNVDQDHRTLSAYGDGVYGWARVLARTVKLATPSP